MAPSGAAYSAFGGVFKRFAGGSLVTPPADAWVYRDATNTGIAGKGLTDADLANYDGADITTDGTVLYRRILSSGLKIKADNVTVRECKVVHPQAGTSYGLLWDPAVSTGSTPKGFVMEDSTFDANGLPGADVSPYPSGWGLGSVLEPNWGYTLTRCNIFGALDILKPQGSSAPTLIDQCFLHTPRKYFTAAGSGTHNDITQIATGAKNVTVRRSTLDGLRTEAGERRVASSSGCQFGSFPNAADVLENIIFEDNYIQGGGYAFTMNKLNGLASVVNCHIRRNRFGLAHAYSSLFNGRTTAAADGGTFTVADNTWAFTGTTDGGLAVTAGQAANS